MSGKKLTWLDLSGIVKCPLDVNGKSASLPNYWFYHWQNPFSY